MRLVTVAILAAGCVADEGGDSGSCNDDTNGPQCRAVPVDCKGCEFYACRNVDGEIIISTGRRPDGTDLVFQRFWPNGHVSYVRTDAGERSCWPDGSTVVNSMCAEWDRAEMDAIGADLEAMTCAVEPAGGDSQ